eukprot:m.13690 g.13690  ORF g.13690 m.13690 type:complete len:61 (+) comp7592_c0_seq1:1101-1283(+)
MVDLRQLQDRIWSWNIRWSAGQEVRTVTAQNNNNNKSKLNDCNKRTIRFTLRCDVHIVFT